LPAGQVGMAYSQSLSVRVSTPLYTPPTPLFTVLSGALPPGLSLSVAGLLGGTPTSGGAFAFTVAAEDENGFTATQAYSLTITNPYPFSGFFPPVDNPPTLNAVKAGTAVPVKFALGGNRGLNIFAAGSPTSQQVTCDSSAPVDAIDQT